MKTKKRAYLEACMAQSVAWLKKSAASPSVCMTKTDVLLHYVAIRAKEGRK